MKKFTLTCLVVILAILLFAQTPQAFKYQAVVRNSVGEIISNEVVGIRISIHDVTAGGTIIYQETFSETTNQFGLVNLEIGNGTAIIGTFTGIDWGNNSKFLEVEIDPAGGSTYVSVGTSELLSVPYALFSEHSKDAVWDKSGNEISYTDGNVGIGISNPVGTLDVRGTGTDDGVVINLGNSDLSHKLTLFGGKQSDPNPFILWKDGDPFRFATDASGFTEWMRVSSNGNVGIGTSNPLDKLHVADHIRVGDDLTYPSIYGELIHDGAGTGFKMNAAGGGWADLHFQTQGTTKMFIESAGKVGVGTTDPWSGLHIKGNGYPNSFLFLQSETGGDAGIRLYESDTVKWHIFSKATNDALTIYNSNNTHTVFYADQVSGNVGIGTTTPGERLEVEGKVAANDGVVIGTCSGVGIHIGTANDNGLQIDNATMDGIHITSTGNDGIYIGSVPGTGVEVGFATNSAFYVGDAVGHGLSVYNTSMDGLNVYNSWDDGVYINQALDIGVYANTTNGAGQWGFYTPDLIYSSKGYTGAKIVAYGKYVGTGTLMPGELVSIAGGFEENIPDEGSIPVIYVDKSGGTNSESLFGVVDYKVSISTEIEEFKNGKTQENKSFRYEDGNIKQGDYLAIVVFGPTDVKVDNKDIIKAGHKLTVSEINGTARQILNSDNWTVGLLGKALEDSNGSGKLQVFVNCK